MKILTPYFIGLIQDACLRSFWRKRALREFLLQCHISGNVLEKLNNGESKSIVLSVIFSSLGRNQSERNQSVLLLIAKNLLEMRTFPDLNGWEDSKQKIAAAVEAQTLLRREYEKMKIVLWILAMREKKK